MIRYFELVRDKDMTGVSGTGRVAFGCQVINDGREYILLIWRSGHSSAVLYNSLADLEAVHCHNGNSRVELVEQLNIYDSAKLQDPRELIETYTAITQELEAWRNVE